MPRKSAHQRHVTTAYFLKKENEKLLEVAQPPPRAKEGKKKEFGPWGWQNHPHSGGRGGSATPNRRCGWLNHP